jgi:hypothetical protein
MSEKEERDRPGLGKVIYSVEDSAAKEKPREEGIDRADVEEADRESFPASDAPSFSGSSKTDSE